MPNRSVYLSRPLPLWRSCSFQVVMHQVFAILSLGRVEPKRAEGFWSWPLPGPSNVRTFRKRVNQTERPLCRSGVRSIACFCLLIGVIGCEESERSIVTVDGTMTVGGQPLSGAFVTFEPMDGTTGPNASAAIMGGQFVIDRNAGLHGGRYRVRVAMIPPGMRAKIPAEIGFAMPPADAVIDPAFDANSTLRCQLKTNEPNTIHFQVEFLDE